MLGSSQHQEHREASEGRLSTFFPLPFSSVFPLLSFSLFHPEIEKKGNLIVFTVSRLLCQIIQSLLECWSRSKIATLQSRTHRVPLPFTILRCDLMQPFDFLSGSRKIRPSILGVYGWLLLFDNYFGLLSLLAASFPPKIRS